MTLEEGHCNIRSLHTPPLPEFSWYIQIQIDAIVLAVAAALLLAYLGLGHIDSTHNPATTNSFGHRKSGCINPASSVV